MLKQLYQRQWKKLWSRDWFYSPIPITVGKSLSLSFKGQPWGKSQLKEGISRKGIVGRLSPLIKNWEWALCFQACCVSSASLGELVVPLVCCFIWYLTRSATASPFCQECLTLELMSQADFSIIQHQKHQDNSFLHSPLVALQAGHYSSCFTAIQAEHPATPPHTTPACYRWITQQFLTSIPCAFQNHWCFQLCIDTMSSKTITKINQDTKNIMTFTLLHALLCNGLYIL